MICFLGGVGGLGGVDTYLLVLFSVILFKDLCWFKLCIWKCSIAEEQLVSPSISSFWLKLLHHQQKDRNDIGGTALLEEITDISLSCNDIISDICVRFMKIWAQYVEEGLRMRTEKRE